MFSFICVKYTGHFCKKLFEDSIRSHRKQLDKEVISNVLKYYYFSDYSPSLPLQGSSFFSPWELYLSIIIAIINNTEINTVLCLSIFLPLWLFPQDKLIKVRLMGQRARLLKYKLSSGKIIPIWTLQQTMSVWLGWFPNFLA